MKVISSTVKDQGMLALWRGNSATMARIVPYAAIQFAAFEQLKNVLSPETRFVQKMPFHHTMNMREKLHITFNKSHQNNEVYMFGSCIHY